MNKDLVKKAKAAIAEGRLEKGDHEMLEIVLEQYKKYPESKRIEITIRELIKRTRVVLKLTEEEMITIRHYAEQMYEVLLQYPHMSVPTKKNRDFDSIVRAVENAHKENLKQ